MGSNTNCEYCNKLHDNTYGSGRFCNVKCARGFSTKSKRLEINKTISERNKRLGIRPPKNLVKPKVLIICKFCKKKLLVVQSSGSRKFCSKDHWMAYIELNRSKFEKYKRSSSFQFNVYEYPDIFNLDLLNQAGWYAPINGGNNLNGVSRDHKISIKFGFVNEIDPYYISHIMNCDLILHTDNQKKNAKCSITFKELKILIEEFNKYGCLSGRKGRSAKPD